MDVVGPLLFKIKELSGKEHVLTGKGQVLANEACEFYLLWLSIYMYLVVCNDRNTAGATS